MDWSLVIIAIIGIVVTGIRASLAGRESKEREAARGIERDRNAAALRSMAQASGMSIDMVIDTGCASLALDRKAGRLSGISDGKQVSWPLSDFLSAALRDRSGAYIHAQEMEQYYTGVRRDSLENPWGGHKRKEVKQGHEDFRAFTGASVYGLELRLRGGETKEIPFFRGDGAKFWTEGSRLEEARKFARELDSAIRSR